jgi:excisionase family DNA binding protein
MTFSDELVLDRDQELSHRLPSEDDKATANKLRSIVADGADHGGELHVVSGHDAPPVDLKLTPALSELLLDLLRHIGRGAAVTIVPFDQMLTTQQAADILNVSRPYLISLLEKDEIQFVLVGRHRRIRAEELFAYKRDRDDRRRKALAELAAMDAETF